MVTLNPMVLEDTIMVVDILMKSNYMFTRYTDPNMFSTNTMGLDLNLTCKGHCIAKWLQPALQRDMWSTRVTLNPIVLEDTILVVEILMKSNYMLTRYT